MKAVFLLLFCCTVGVALYFAFVGSYWYFFPKRPMLVYQHVDGSIKKLPISAELNNEKVEVHECYFDKTDAYVQVKFRAGYGYAFDHRQKYVWGWRLPSSGEWSFSRSYDCWRFVSQFGQ